MSRLLLDTTFLVDADRSKTWLDELIADDDEVAIAAITVAELHVGVSLADETHQADRQQFVDEVGESIPIVEYDAAVAAAHAELLTAVRRRGPPRGTHDVIIAATANATQREVVTADRSAYEDLPRCQRAIPPELIDFGHLHHLLRRTTAAVDDGDRRFPRHGADAWAGQSDTGMVGYGVDARGASRCQSSAQSTAVAKNVAEYAATVNANPGCT